MIDIIALFVVLATVGGAMIRPKKLTAKRWEKHEHKTVII